MTVKQLKTIRSICIWCGCTNTKKTPSAYDGYGHFCLNCNCSYKEINHPTDLLTPSLDKACEVAATLFKEKDWKWDYMPTEKDTKIPNERQIRESYIYLRRYVFKWMLKYNRARDDVGAGRLFVQVDGDTVLYGFDDLAVAKAKADDYFNSKTNYIPGNSFRKLIA